MTIKECKPFKHKLGYVTHREDYVECSRCFRHWKLMTNEDNLESVKKTKDMIYRYKKLKSQFPDVFNQVMMQQTIFYGGKQDD